MDFSAFLLLAIVGTHVVSASEHVSWTYDGKTNGQDNWEHLKLGGHNQCGLSAQSPIDINVLKTEYDAFMKPLYFKNFDRVTSNVTIVNTGHSIQINSPDWKQVISGGPLYGNFKLLQMHFHWGKDSYRGSEHLINGKRYPIELHMVHSQVPEPNEPSTGALSVVGIFFDLSKESSNGIQKITKAIKGMKTHEAVDIPSDLSPSMLLPSTKNFFTYEGSLTTPPCSEVVTWIVLRDPLKISEEDLEIFRSTFFEDNTPMVDNFRKAQKLNDRKVRTSFVINFAPVTLSSLSVMILSAILCNQWNFF